MNDETKYSYQKKIRELEIWSRDLERQLNDYRVTCLEIFDAITDNFGSNKGTSEAWILKRMRRCFK